MIGRMPAKRLERRMTLGDHPALLGHLSLEPLRLGTVTGDGRVPLAHDRRRGAELTACVVSQDHDHSQRCVTLRRSEERDDTPPFGDRSRDRVTE
jgi:hypothetical protein